MKLVLEFIDTKTNCILNEVQFECAEEKELYFALGIDSIELHETYVLDKNELAFVSKLCGIKKLPDAKSGILRRHLLIDDLPYQVHTNRELLLMLRGEKPLSIFVEEVHDCSNIMARETDFEPYVREGKIIKQIFYSDHRGNGVRRKTVLFALPDEVWRIDEYLKLMDDVKKQGWSEDAILKEGRLLGYEDWQNHAYIAALKSLNCFREEKS